MESKKPLAMSIQLVVTEAKRLACEVEVVFDDGTTVFKRIDANEKLTIHFEDLLREPSRPSVPPH